MYRLTVALNILFFLGAAAQADTGVRTDEVARLHQVFDEHWERSMRENPEWASYLGDRRFNQRWTDLTPAARESRHQSDRRALSQLSEIDREALPADEQVNLDLFKRRYSDRVEGYRFRKGLIPISQRGGIQTLDEMGNRLRMQSVQDYEDWLLRLSKFDDLMSQTIALMEQGIRQGIVPPRITMSRVPAQIEKQIVDSTEQSLFFKTFRTFPDDFSESTKNRLQAQALVVIRDKVIPSYRRLKTFFSDTYLPSTRESIGASSLPDGREFYEYEVRRFTTTDMTPDQVHQLGLREVARNRTEMEKVRQEVGYDGTLDEFMTHLRTDPQFFYQDPAALLEGYRAISKQIDPLLVTLFGKLPRMPYGVIAIPDAVAPDTTTAYYMRPAADGSRPGYYYVNLYRPETRPRWEMEVLSVHEAVPGHHLQIALQQELEALPSFRRYSGFTAFTEGWGLYSERLGYEMGLYKDPYSRFGQLTYDMWRSVRLVVDTGIHYRGWSRQQAIDYFMANAPKSELDITNEIDRYISWPGQALAYKLGQLKILELRARAENTLGDDFDVRDFHDVVLAQGAVPLDVLDDLISTWLEQTRGSTDLD